MSISMKQLKKALTEVAQAPKEGKNKKRNAKRRQKRKAVSLAVPGTFAGAAASSIRQAMVRMSHREYLGQLTATGATTEGSFSLSPSTFPWLAEMAKCFEKYQWTSLVLEYIPDVGTTKDGSVALGVDWGTSSAKLNWTVESHLDPLLGIQMVGGSYTRADVLAMTPSVVTPLWKPCVMSLPVAMLQSRRWYSVDKPTASNMDDTAPGALAYLLSAANGLVAGDIWVRYGVVFAGTRKP